jgi:uncharacterized protein (TIGR00725 family)
MTCIAVIGPGSTDEVELLDRARQVGRLLGKAGFAVITGGLGGVMAAAAEGARESGGLVVGVLPGDRAADANEWVSVAVATGMGQARNVVLVNSAAGVIAIGKGHGTLSEIALALRAGKPVAALSSWEVDPAVYRAANPSDAVAFIGGRVGWPVAPG